MPIAFTYPTGNLWALFVWTFSRPLEEDIQTSIFTWFTMNIDIPLAYTQASFETSVQANGRPFIFSQCFPDGVQIGYNYYIQGATQKYSNSVAVGITAAPYSEILPTGNCYLINKYGNATFREYLGPTRVPFIPKLFVGSEGRLNLLGRSAVEHAANLMKTQFFVGSGLILTPVVYSIKNDAFTPIKSTSWRDRPYYLRRRRYRARKIGHTVTAPLNWRAAGHW